MSNYFILSKDLNHTIDNNQDNRILQLNSRLNYILPDNNISYYSQNGLSEKDLIEWCRQLGDKNKIMLDIGAHTGTYSISLSKYFKQVHAFEPQKMTYYALCGSVALSGIRNIDCHNLGLGNTSQDGIQILKIISLDGGGSGLHNKDGIIGEEQIKIKTLDQLNLNDVAFIKMDVEENELQVLQGAVDTIKRSGYPKILFESNRENPELFNFITSLGYFITRINRYPNMFLAHK